MQSSQTGRPWPQAGWAGTPVSIADAVRARRSVRTYDGRPLTPEDRAAIEAFAKASGNPFGETVSLHIVDRAVVAGGEKLGTYGVIKGAGTFLGVSVPEGRGALLAAGYELESLVLYATARGLGTVWLAATFTRDAFASAMGVPDDAVFPAIAPIGYPAAKPRPLESLMRAAAGSSRRKPWEALFYEGDFATPLTRDAAGPYAEPLEAVRLAPSAVNAQPWRVVKDGNAWHFYAMYREGLSKGEESIKWVDLGIALAHFRLSALEQGLEGAFREDSQRAAGAPGADAASGIGDARGADESRDDGEARCSGAVGGVPKGAHYVITWVANQISERKEAE